MGADRGISKTRNKLAKKKEKKKKKKKDLTLKKLTLPRFFHLFDRTAEEVHTFPPGLQQNVDGPIFPPLHHASYSLQISSFFSYPVEYRQRFRDEGAE